MTKITEWFPEDVKPVRKGIYETSFPFSVKSMADTEIVGYSHWNGKRWGSQYTRLDQCQESMKEDIFNFLAEQDKKWRGFTTKQN